VNVLSIFKTQQPMPAPEMTDEQRLQEVEVELSATESALTAAVEAVGRYNATHKDFRRADLDGRVYFRVGELNPDRVRQQLEAKCDQLIRERSTILGERSRLLMKMGVVR